jgi:hypothetical protein
MPQNPLGRVRFVECLLEDQGAEVSARVVLATRDGGAFTGLSRGNRKDADLWQPADAAVEALRQALKLGPDALKLRDVVAFEIGGSPAVAVELRGLLEGETRRLHGLCRAEADRPRAAALAVLAASNRFFGEGASAE